MTTKIDTVTKINEKFLFFLAFTLGAIINIFTLPINGRSLLHYDDMVFIYPLKSMSIHDYFFKWAMEKGHFPYPVRDMTFFLDFFLEKILGFGTYWIQNYLIFCLVAYFFYRLFKLFFTEGSWWPLALFLIFFFHPINIEVIQWAYNRKHLLATLFTIIPTYYFMKHYFAKSLDHKKIVITFLLHIPSYFCISSSILWAILPYLMLKKEWKQFKYSLALMTFIEVALIIISSLIFTEHFITAKSIFSWDFLSNLIGIVAAAVGRSTFNLLIPIQLVPYFVSNHPYNEVGFWFFLIAILVLIYWIIYKKELLSTPVSFVLFGIIIIAPSGVHVPFYNYYVWADRYLMIGWPYVMLGFSLMLTTHHLFQKNVMRFKTHLQKLAVILLLFFVWQDFRDVKAWETEVTLMDFCADKEGTSICHIWSIKKAYDRYGFAQAYPRIQKAKKNYDLIVSQSGSYEFEMDLPFMESMAIVQEQNTTSEEKFRLINNLINEYSNPIPFCFARTLVLLRMGKVKEAYDNLQLVSYPFFHATTLIVNALDGQLEAMCELLPSNDQKENCLKRKQEFSERMKKNAGYEQKPYNFGRSNTFISYELGQKSQKDQRVRPPQNSLNSNFPP